jgi:uncharacterized protein (DUF2267 family)
MLFGMKFTGLDVFDSTIQLTNAWLKDLMQELNWQDHRKTYLAFRCVLHAIRDHLPVHDAVAFGEELPMLVRGFYFDHWDPTGKPLPLRTGNDFLVNLSAYMARDPAGSSQANPEVLARAVFRLLEKKTTDGEMGDVQHLMPGVLLELWPQTLRAA